MLRYCYVGGLLLFLSVYHSAAWCHEGHQAVGMVTMSVISSPSSAQLKRLMGGKDIVDTAGWAHRIEKKFPELEPLHYLYQPVKNQCDNLVLSDTNCNDNYCLVRAAQHFFGRLTSNANLVKLDYPTALQFTDTDAVRFLVNLLADLHQPLRLGFQSDQGGKNISLFYADITGKKKETSLFEFWDTDIIQRLATENPSFWFGGWTHANNLGKRLISIKEEWEKQPIDQKHLLFEKWALESLQKACALVYIDPSTSQAITSGYEAKSIYEYSAFEVIKTQLLVAGARVALVLDFVLKERDVGKLRQGSAFDIIGVDEENLPGGLSLSGQRYFKSFCINLTIIFVVLSVLAYIARFYSPSSSTIASSASSHPTISKHDEKRS